MKTLTEPMQPIENSRGQKFRPTHEVAITGPDRRGVSLGLFTALRWSDAAIRLSFMAGLRIAPPRGTWHAFTEAYSIKHYSDAIAPLTRPWRPSVLGIAPLLRGQGTWRAPDSFMAALAIGCRSLLCGTRLVPLTRSWQPSALSGK